MSDHLAPLVAGLAIAGAALLGLLGVAATTAPAADGRAETTASSEIHAAAGSPDRGDGFVPMAIGAAAGATALWLGGAMYMSRRRG